MKPKKKTAGKSEKRKFHPLRQQIEFWFIGLFLLSMVITTVINGLFLEHYYISKKTDVLQEAVKNLEALKMTTDSDGKCSADISDEMFKEIGLSAWIGNGDDQELYDDEQNEELNTYASFNKVRFINSNKSNYFKFRNEIEIFFYPDEDIDFDKFIAAVKKRMEEKG